jgi:hypothetical protein
VADVLGSACPRGLDEAIAAHITRVGVARTCLPLTAQEVLKAIEYLHGRGIALRYATDCRHSCARIARCSIRTL